MPKDASGAQEGGWKEPIKRPGQSTLPNKVVINIKGSAKSNNPGEKKSSY
jgi:hypothetical protein